MVQAQRSQELNRQFNQEKEKQEKLAQVKQLIEQNRLDLDKYAEPYYFPVGKKIKKLYVNEDIAKQLSNGQLAIVTLDDLYEIVPAKVARITSYNVCYTKLLRPFLSKVTTPSILAKMV